MMLRGTTTTYSTTSNGYYEYDPNHACDRCDWMYGDHVEGRCLFSPTRFKPSNRLGHWHTPIWHPTPQIYQYTISSAATSAAAATVSVGFSRDAVKRQPAPKQPELFAGQFGYKKGKRTLNPKHTFKNRGKNR